MSTRGNQIRINWLTRSVSHILCATYLVFVLCENSQGDVGVSTLVVIRIIDFMIDTAFEDETEF